MGQWSYKFQSASRTPDRGSTVGPFQLHRLGIIDSDLELLAGHGGVLFGPAQGGGDESDDPTVESDGQKAKLKPFSWDKVLANHGYQPATSQSTSEANFECVVALLTPSPQVLFGLIVLVLISSITSGLFALMKGSTSLSSMKCVRGSTWGKNSDEIRKILGHSIAVDNETMAVEVKY
ncbi:hypothetical protein RHMOL_Rhmol11G0066700 [Rhododendron molle]|uniref:Uncharacterized protein n=1 Tax=Rhododendron molle TaxID=49168 RepID=A0ACC0LP84_RHOML|nr:hypothetical protein RHMOL_Rhmol11G0066700 [Rhododendron molle]